MKKNLRELLARRLKEIRESKGLSQRVLSEKFSELSKGNATVSGIENAKRNVTIDTIEKLAGALEIDVIELLNFTQFESQMPEIIKQVHNRYPEIPEMFLKIYIYCYKQGLRFQDMEDYYYLWIIMNAIDAKKRE